MLEPYFKDDVREIKIKQPEEIQLIKVNGTREIHQDKALSKRSLYRFAELMATFTGQEFDGRKRSDLSFPLPGGHRVQIISGNNTEFGFAMAIRVKRQQKYTLENFNFSSQDKLAILNAIKNRETLLISGQTDCGKTSLLNVLIRYISRSIYINNEETTDYEDIIAIEGVPEIDLPGNNHIRLLYSENATGEGLGPEGLLNVTLRMSPGRIICGEIRKQNAFTFAEAINTGHEGSLATIHANDPDSAIEKIVNYIGDKAEPAAMRSQLRHSIYGVIQLSRKHNEIHGYFQLCNTLASQRIAEVA